MFASPAWQAVQLAWESAEDADDQSPQDRARAPVGAGHAGTRRPVWRRPDRRAPRRSGYDVVGGDRTQRFLEVGRDRDEGVRYVRADMREQAFASVFDAAICFWGSFGYFDAEGDLAQARSAARALVPGGRYLVDVLAEEAIAARFRERESYEVGSTAVEERRVWAPDGRIETTWTFTRGDERVTHRSSIPRLSLDELTDLLSRAGFTAFEARDDALQPFGRGSTRLWLVAATD